MKIRALRTLRGDAGTIRRGASATVSDPTAKSLIARGLAEEAPDDGDDAEAQPESESAEPAPEGQEAPPPAEAKKAKAPPRRGAKRQA